MLSREGGKSENVDCNTLYQGEVAVHKEILKVLLVLYFLGNELISYIILVGCMEVAVHKISLATSIFSIEVHVPNRESKQPYVC
jgi:hypothetical protein